MEFDNHRDAVEFFFGSNPIGQTHSSLSLLRNDIQSLGQEKNPYYFPRAICLMVVIDLLAKMRFGEIPPNHQVGTRFKGFVNAFGNIEGIKCSSDGIEIDIGTVIYAFRNALHHSFNMASNVTIGGLDTYDFSLINSPENEFFIRVSGNVVQINFHKLEIFVNHLIKSYKEYILRCQDPEECKTFAAMLKKYGIMRIG